MSNSHATVGKQFGNLKQCNGSRMSTSNIQRVTPHTDDMTTYLNRLFYPVQTGISYRTPVARIMRNVHTKQNELWIASQYYSSSTERHKGYFRSGFVAAGNSPDNIFITPALSQAIDRHNPTIVHTAIHQINQTLQEVDKPRLREATRRGTIASCIERAKRVMHNFSYGVPLDMVDATAFYDLHATLDFLITTHAVADIDEVRAAVKGYLALLDNTTRG